MPIKGDSRKLPPWPDELVDAARREDAIHFLVNLRLPPGRSPRLWARWCRYVGVTPFRADYRALELAAPLESEE